MLIKSDRIAGSQKSATALLTPCCHALRSTCRSFVRTKGGLETERLCKSSIVTNEAGISNKKAIDREKKQPNAPQPVAPPAVSDLPAGAPVPQPIQPDKGPSTKDEEAKPLAPHFDYPTGTPGTTLRVNAGSPELAVDLGIGASLFPLNASCILCI